MSNLTHVDNEILTRIAQGETIDQIALSIGLHSNAVYERLRRARKRLNAVTTNHLIAMYVAGVLFNTGGMDAQSTNTRALLMLH